ncbi:hypothetical protein L6R53_32960 [Myxococcota bacterium]|nr:hypothetical protein [Myxococcota bacterium]
MPLCFIPAFALLACTSMSTDDTGPIGPTDAGGTDAGSTSPGPLCREVVTPYDDATAPIAYKDFAYDVLLWNGLDEITWTVALDGSESGSLSLHPELTGERSVVDWVEDESAEAVYPCQDGPATRVGVRFLGAMSAVAGVGPALASGWLEGWFEGTPDAVWLNRVRTTDVTLSEDWDRLIDTAEAEAGHSGADRVLALLMAGGSAQIELGSEAGGWTQTWWSGDLDPGKSTPSSRTPDSSRR